MSWCGEAFACRPGWLLTLLWLLMTAPWWSGLKAIPFDSLQQFYPALAFEVQQLRQLHGPWWNPLLFGGYPQFADPQMMTFQPTMVLPMLAWPGGGVAWFDMVVLLHVLAGGLGCLQLGRSYRLHAGPGLLVALTFMFGGVAASRLQHTPMIVSYALIPWIWLGMRTLSSRPCARQMWLLALPLTLCALQLTQLTYLIALCACCYGIGLVWAQPRGNRVRCLGWLACAAGIALLASAMQWLPTLAWLGQTNRAAQSLDAAAAGSTSLAALSTVLAGNLLSHTRGTYWGGGDLSQDYAYVGAIPVALWLLWGRAAVRRFPVLCRVLMVICLAAIVYALGVGTPLYGWLHAWFPGVDLFRRPADALFLSVPCLGMLAGLALQMRIEGQRLAPHWPSVVAASGLLLVAGAFAVGHHNVGGATIAIAISLVFGVSACWCLRGQGTLPRRALVGLVALVVMDLLLHNVARRFNAVGLRSRALVGQIQPNPRSTGQEALNLMLQESAEHPGIPERVQLYGLATLNNGAMVHGVALLGGYNPMMDARYGRFVGVQGLPSSSGAADVDSWGEGRHAPALDLAGLRVAISETPFPGAQPSGRLFVKRRRTVLPRVLSPTHVLRHTTEFPDPQAFAETDFKSTLWLHKSERAGACATGGVRAEQLQVQSYRPNAMKVSYRASAPAWIVINERAASGWQAEVDGQPVLLMRANGIFRAACVPAGARALTLSYSPLRMVREGLAVRGPSRSQTISDR